MLAVVFRRLQEHLANVAEEHIVLDLLLGPVEEDDDLLSQSFFELGFEVAFEASLLEFEVFDLEVDFVLLAVEFTDVLKLSGLCVFEDFFSVVLPGLKVPHGVH